MPLPWPTFTTWTRIREEDRAALSDVLAELLAHGALIGDAGRDRELYLLAREYEPELCEYLAPLHLLLVPDSDRPIFLLRPVSGDCGLLARFNRAETLLVLTLWRIYHDARMEQAVEAVVVTANDIWQRLKLYFEQIELPTPAQLRDMLGTLRRRRLVRVAGTRKRTNSGNRRSRFCQPSRTSFRLRMPRHGSSRPRFISSRPPRKRRPHHESAHLAHARYRN